MPWTAHDRPFLDPAVVSRLGTLELKARTVVEGLLSGLHRSPFKGFSVEFAEYRQYIPGDDISTIDWKLYAIGLGGLLGSARGDDQLLPLVAPR